MTSSFPAHARSGAALALALTLVGGCEMMNRPNPAGPSSTTLSASDLSSEAGACVAEINRLRGTIGLPPLAWSETIQTFSNEAARVDGEAHEVHKHFYATSGGHGVSIAQNEIPWWKLSQWGSVSKVVKEGLAMEWAEGPGGYHYDTLVSTKYTSVGCGIAIVNGEVTVAHDFR